MIDLNFMMYTNMNVDSSQESIDDFLDVYYAHFASILAANNMTMKFTLPMLRKEFNARNMFGFLMAAGMIPRVLIEDDEDLELEISKELCILHVIEEVKKNAKKFIPKNPLLTSRFLTMFDELKRRGFFNFKLSK